MTNSNRQDPKERRGNAQFVAYSLIIGTIIGVVVFAVTQNPAWIGIFSGLGVVVGAAFEANRATEVSL